jgi:hypothetical protein
MTTVCAVKITRNIPRGSEHRVAMSQPVKALDVIAVHETPGEYRVLKASDRLRIDPAKLDAYMIKRQDERVEKGDVIALRKVTFGLRTFKVTSPIPGWIAHVGDGKIIIAGEPVQKDVFAAVPGKIVGIEPDSHIIIESQAALVHAAWGYGSLAWGTLRVLDTTPGLDTPSGRFTIDHRGAIIAIGSPVTREFLDGATEIRAKGVIASSLPASMVEYIKTLEYPVIVTQGFGQMIMSDKILSLLNTYNGREVSLDVSSSTDWRDSRPQIIIPVSSSGQAVPEDRFTLEAEFKPGNRVRILQVPHFGVIATVASIPDRLLKLENGLWVGGAEVQLSSGEKTLVPFANLEYLG